MYVAVRLGRNDAFNIPNQITIIGVYETADEARKAIKRNSTYVFANLNGDCEFQPDGDRRLVMGSNKDVIDLYYGNEYDIDYRLMWLVLEESPDGAGTGAFDYLAYK